MRDLSFQIDTAVSPGLPRVKHCRSARQRQSRARNDQALYKHFSLALLPKRLVSVPDMSRVFASMASVLSCLDASEIVTVIDCTDTVS